MTPLIQFRFVLAAVILAVAEVASAAVAPAAFAQSAAAAGGTPGATGLARIGLQGSHADTVPKPLRVSTDTNVDLRLAARRVIDAAKFAAFITLDATGHPVARTVQPEAPDSSMVVWFATNPHTRKVGEVARDSRATLYYFDPESLAYVSLVGRARIVRDRAEQDRHWNAAWDAHYPDRKFGVVLVEVTPEHLEVVDIKRGVRGDSITWRPPTLPIRKPGAR